MAEEKTEEIQKSEYDKALEVAERLEKATAAAQSLLLEQQSFEAKKLLGGKAQAGMPEEKPKEETPKEYAARILRGGI